MTFPFMSNSISSRYPNPHLNTGILAYSIGYTLLAPILDFNNQRLIPEISILGILRFKVLLCKTSS